MANADVERFDWAEDAMEAAGVPVDENKSYSNDAIHDQDHDSNGSSSGGDADSLNGSIAESGDTDCESESQTEVQAPLKLEASQPSSQASNRRPRNISIVRSSPFNPPKTKPAYAWHHEWFKSLGGWVGLALVSDYNLMPGPWGAHLLDLCLDVKRAVPFISPMDLTHEDFIVKGTKMAELREVRGLGIEVNVEVLTSGECELLGLDQTMRWRCKPSPLRRSWTLIEVEKSEELGILGEKEPEQQASQKKASHNQEPQEEELQEEDSEEEESEDETFYERVSREEASQEEESLIFAFEEEWF